MSYVLETVIVAEVAKAIRTKNYARLSLISLLAMIISLLVYLVEEPKSSSLPPVPHSTPIPTQPLPQPSKSIDIPLTALLVSAGIFVFGSIGTASGVILGWRKETREAQEHLLKIEKLELELAEARRKSGEP